MKSCNNISEKNLKNVNITAEYTLKIISGAFTEMPMNLKIIFCFCPFWFQTDFTMIRGMIKKISLIGHAILLSSMEERKIG